jgi:plastocyanin
MRTRGLAAATAVLVLVACTGGSKKPSAATTTTSTSAAGGGPTSTSRPVTTTTAQSGAPTTVGSHTATTRGPRVPPLRQPTLTITANGYQPTSISALPNGDVIVFNADKLAHTVTADNGAFDTGPIAPNVTYVFPAPVAEGSYGFHDTLHGAFRGTLVVSR